MNYMMFVCVEDSVELDPEERAAIGPDTEAWVAEMDGLGVRLQGHELAAVQDATTVRVRAGRSGDRRRPFRRGQGAHRGLRHSRLRRPG